MLTRLDPSCQPFAGGRLFGSAGAHEQLSGTAFFALAPDQSANRAITDLDLAPRDAHGWVRFSADVRMLRPVDASKSNRRLVLDVVNRGNPVAIRNTDLGIRAPEPESECWLLQQGYSVVSCGWQHNVPTGTSRLGLQAPEALEHGAQLLGQVRSIVQVNAQTHVIGVADEPSAAEHTAYAVHDLNDPSLTLTEREYPLGAGHVIPREQWRFDAGRTHIRFDAGFVPGKIYEIIYTAQGAPVTGVCFAASRDIASFLRFAPAHDGNPCADSIDFALAVGGSQTGHLLRHMLYLGMCVDEADRLVLDGALTLIAGPMRTEANWRFGQPSFIGPDSPGFAFPFADIVQTDPTSSITDGLLSRLGQHGGRLPKVMHINTSAEYANLDVGLIHMSADGQADAEIPNNVRIYHLAGTHHGGGSLRLDNRVFSGVSAYYQNSIDYRPLVRAAFRNLDAWVTLGTEPPPSRYPRFSDGTLVKRSAVEPVADRLPGRACLHSVCTRRNGLTTDPRRASAALGFSPRIAAVIQTGCRRSTRTATRSPASAIRM